MRPMRPFKSIRVQKLRIPTPHGGIPALLLSPVDAPSNATGVLWLHGGGYAVGMKEMVYASRAADLVRDFGAVVLSPGYRLSPLAPYPVSYTHLPQNSSSTATASGFTVFSSSSISS